MSSYPPSSSAMPVPGEEYELTAAGSVPNQHPQPRASMSRPRKLTLHPNASSSLLFAAPGAATSRPRNRRRASSAATPGSPETSMRRVFSPQNFLSDDLNELGPDNEEVQVPDFGHILGFSEGDDHHSIAANMRSRWKRKLYLLMEEPSSGREAFFIHVAVTGAILFSAVLTTLSTLPSFHTSPASVKALFGLDTTLVVLFTVEYITRSLAHSDSWSMYYNWATSFFAILDLLSILPYYIEVARQEDTSILFRFSILRTLRLLRVFRAFKYENQMLLTIEVMYVAVRRSKDALIAISYFIVLVLVLFSTLIYFAERGTWDATLGAFVDSDGDVSLFDSIPQTAWFALVTMSTAGYGDVVPKSALGKIMSVPLLMFGLLLIALPSFVLGRNFAIVYDAMVSFQQHAPVSPRDSISEPPTPKRPSNISPVSDNADTPLLPVANPVHNGRASPNPLMAVTEERSTAASPAPAVRQQQPPMWHQDGLGHSHTHTPSQSMSQRQASRDKDLTNIKLAKNQYVLLEQIESLRRTIDKQGEMLSLLMSALALKEGVDIDLSSSKVDKGKAKEAENPFDFGGDDDGQDLGRGSM